VTRCGTHNNVDWHANSLGGGNQVSLGRRLQPQYPAIEHEPRTCCPGCCADYTPLVNKMMDTRKRLAAATALEAELHRILLREHKAIQRRPHEFISLGTVPHQDHTNLALERSRDGRCGLALRSLRLCEPMARILVIDDEEYVRRVVGVMLKNAGHEVVLAFDGNDGLRQFQQQHFDLVICDIFMPQKEGLATLQELRRLDHAVPIVMMSGGGPSSSHWGGTPRDYLAMARELGATRAIQKPFRYSQMIRLVQECLAKPN
jgi:CheY-like chemotaxis protein